MKPLPAISALALLVLVLASLASAQTVYKSIMPDGKVLYGEKPVPGAKKIETIEPPPAKTGTTTITPQEKARAERLARTPAAGTLRDRDFEAARKALQQAEAARETGKEPLPGERQGIKGGGSRLNDAYTERQKSLDEAVASARKRVDELQSGR